MSKIEHLVHLAKEYVSLRIHLTELKLGNKSSLLASSLITISILFMIAFFFVLVLTVGLALWIGDSLGQSYLGFLIMAGFYLVVGLVLFIFRNKWIKEPVNNLIVKELFDED